MKVYALQLKQYTDVIVRDHWPQILLCYLVSEGLRQVMICVRVSVSTSVVKEYQSHDQELMNWLSSLLACSITVASFKDLFCIIPQMSKILFALIFFHLLLGLPMAASPWISVEKRS